jgi:hypothetical protein
LADRVKTTEPPPDIVEMIDDDVDVFGGRSFDHPGKKTARTSRWIGPAAAGVLVALIGYGVVTSSIDSAPAAAPAAPGVIKPQYYVADAPPGFTLYSAEQRGQRGGSTDGLFGSGPAQLWATDDASATSGSWFVVSRDTHHSTGRSAYRTLVDGIQVTIEHDPASGQSRLSFVKHGVDLEITSFGWLDRQLVRLVRSVSADDSSIQFSDDFFITDHKRVLAVDPESALFGVPAARVAYTTGLPAALAQSFTITVSGVDEVDRSKVLKFALVDSTSFAVGDVPATIGRSAADPTVSVAQWLDGPRLITVSGNLPARQMEAFAAGVHKSSDSAVRKLLRASPAPEVADLRAQPETIVSGMLSDGWGWTIAVSTRDPGDASAGYLWWIGQPGDSTRPSETRPSAPGGTPSIETIVEHGRTYVLAKVPRSVSGSQLHINPTGLASTVTPLLDIDPQMADLFTAAVFFDAVPFTARIVDGAGNTIASWPPG